MAVILGPAYRGWYIRGYIGGQGLGSGVQGQGCRVGSSKSLSSSRIHAFRV